MSGARRARGRDARVVLLVGTRKGAFILRDYASRRTWKIEGPIFLGAIVNHMVQDPRDRRILLMASSTGHLGPTVHRSPDGGKTWKEATRPPAFPKAPEGDKGKAVEKVFWLTPGHASQPGTWYAGTTPFGLFRTDDGGATWGPVDGFNIGVLGHPDWKKSFGGPPDGEMTHSIVVDPRDPRHLYISLSAGGTFESLDAGSTWTPLNAGVASDFNPEKDPVVGHDPHCMILHPQMPDRLYQQNHCGIYRLDRPGTRWTRIGTNMPKEIGDIGFPIVAHPRDPDTAWVVPMDGGTVWPRTSLGGKPAVYRTSDAGASWTRQDRGLPRSQAWLTIKRQAFACDGSDPVGLYFGSTSGGIWASADEGRSWRQIAAHLPHIYSVATATP
ncbi:MAG: glycosyl hydrolase [Planctomycetes bacterium]|nr:glycosyl hydrolase [Planctomycetota bacterium]